MTLRRWSPLALIAAHNSQRTSVAPSAFFSPKYQKERELYCAGHFALAYGQALAPCEVLLQEPDPQNHVDFFLATSTGNHPFQLTERQEPGRRRGDEYRTGRAKPVDESSLALAANEGPAWIAEAVKRKRDAYAGELAGLNLLVYVNFPAYELEYSVAVAALTTRCNDFGSIWLLTGDALSCIKSSAALGELPGWYNTPAITNEAYSGSQGLLGPIHRT